MLILRLEQIRALLTMGDVLECTRSALVAHHRGAATGPAPWHFDVPAAGGEIHVKGAHLDGDPYLAVKIATGFPRNAALGLPTSDGLITVLDASTGSVAALLLDDGYLTEARTAAAGALATDALARPDARTVVVVGTGGQARHQIEALLALRSPDRLVVAGRRHDAARDLARWAATVHDGTTEATTDIGAAVRAADAVITVTNAGEPIVTAAMVRPGTHITAVGSDGPGKRELDPALIRAAGLIAVDDERQSRTLGELKSIEGALPVTTIGAVLDGSATGRRDPDDITIADLTGLGAQDSAIASLVVRRARAAGES